MSLAGRIDANQPHLIQRLSEADDPAATTATAQCWVYYYYTVLPSIAQKSTTLGECGQTATIDCCQF